MSESGIYSLTKFTKLDFQGKSSCIIWFAGCNMACKFCYNKPLTESRGRLSLEHIKEFLESRVGILDAVVLSGGEATLYRDLPDLAKYIKDLGFLVKLDTNGTNPKMIKNLIDEGLVDYLAIDYKAPKDKFKDVTNSGLWEKFQASLDLLIENQEKVPFEVRTTWHTALLSEEDVAKILEDLNSKGYHQTFYLQKCNLVDSSIAFAVLPQSEEINLKQFMGGKIPVEVR
ncbi:MAG TPA: anaerobic ribonucleoside-triphosphate reductase activating protein [Alphaproteobacteria bacterium]|nr:anaerobic ribonucleoside-triphosphate reductase activating protein [Alphaproteobacteria bacterium]